MKHGGRNLRTYPTPCAGCLRSSPLCSGFPNNLKHPRTRSDQSLPRQRTMRQIGHRPRGPWSSKDPVEDPSAACEERPVSSPAASTRNSSTGLWKTTPSWRAQNQNRRKRWVAQARCPVRALQCWWEVQHLVAAHSGRGTGSPHLRDESPHHPGSPLLAAC